MKRVDIRKNIVSTWLDWWWGWQNFWKCHPKNWCLGNTHQVHFIGDKREATGSRHSARVKVRTQVRSSHHGTVETIWPGSVRLQVWSLALLSGLGSGVATNCGVGGRCGLDPALLWLWRRPTALALIGPLAWEPPYAVGMALKSKTKNKKQNQKNKTNKKKNTTKQLQWSVVWIHVLDGICLDIFHMLSGFVACHAWILPPQSTNVCWIREWLGKWMNEWMKCLKTSFLIPDLKKKKVSS